MPALAQPVHLPLQPKRGGRTGGSPAARLHPQIGMEGTAGGQHDTEQLGGGKLRVLSTYGAAARPSRWADPRATVPRRWSRPCSASFPSRSANHCSTRLRSALRWGKRTAPGPGQQHRDGWLGVLCSKGTVFNFGTSL